MLADPTSQEEVNAAAAALQSAVENLVSIAELREYCAGHADYTEDAYTAESYAAYAEAFEAAQAVLGKADASQDEVDAAAEALEAAAKALVKVTDSSQPSDGGNQTTEKPPVTAVKTGVTETAGIIYAVTLILSLGAISVLVWRRRVSK